MYARTPLKALTFALVSTLLFAMPHAPAGAQTKSPTLTKNPTQAKSPAQTKSPARASAGTVIFAVSKYESDATMEPVAIYSRGAFTKPPVDGEESVVNSFVSDYYKTGRRYRLLSGGAEAGSVTVKEYQGQGCVGLVAGVSVSTSVRLGGNVQALATSSPTLGRRESSRRAPTDIERMTAVMQAQAAYAANRVGAALVKKMEVVNLTATDLDGDGTFEIIGSFRIDRNNANVQDSYTLFTIYEPATGPDMSGFQPSAPKPSLVWFHHGGEGEYADRRFVDQLDIDGDGVAEVVAAGGYYESNDYVIYKKQRGQWRAVYQGGGGGC
jgi:hypothetical protein